MNAAPHSTSPDQDKPVGPTLRDGISSAIRFWERRRPAYNIALTLLVFGWVVFTWPHFFPAFSFFTFIVMLKLAAVANLCYCAAYLVDILLQLLSPTQEFLRRYRTVLWWVGMIFALALACYWIGDEIYPYV